MKARWTHPALADLIDAQDYIARENPAVALAVAQRVWDATRQLETHPQIGRSGHVPGTREWVVRRTPYVIVYRITADTVEILRVWHSKRRWLADEESEGICV